MSSRKFYRLIADPAATSRWYLKSPIDPSGNEVDPRLFTQGVPVGSQPALRLPLRRKGDEVGFNFCDFDMVVTPATVNAELEALAGRAIQRIPVRIDATTTQYEILNVCELVPCFDESRSLFTKWTDADGRPERVGQLRMVAKLKIDPSRADRHHLFRLAGWPIALIASQEVKSLFESRNMSGLKYEQVN
jgi:hypothetical protein